MKNIRQTLSEKFSTKSSKNSPLIIKAGGDTFHYNEQEQLHRGNDLPAIERMDGGEEYYTNGKRNRGNDKPAIIKKPVDLNNLPKNFPGDCLAVEFLCGYQAWYEDDVLHRKNNKPAILSEDGDKLCYFKGKLHNDEGYAVDFVQGPKMYFIHGIPLSAEAFGEYQKTISTKLNKFKKLFT